jgi:MEMO1 family protein
MNDKFIRNAAVAGTFYPDSPDVLRDDIRKYLDRAKPSVPPDHITGIIAPHAGYSFSGWTAAHAYKQIEGKKYKRVIVFAVSHRVDFRGASVYIGDAYETPLGQVRVDRALAENLVNSSDLFSNCINAHIVEHSLEVQIPFLQEVLGEFLLLPVLIRGANLSTCRNIARDILSMIPENERDELLVVGSTDLYHGYNYEEGKSRDKELADILVNFDTVKLEEKFQSGEIMACGSSPMLTTMLLCRDLGADNIDLLDLTTSSDVTGQKAGYVVGYLSAVIY